MLFDNSYSLIVYKNRWLEFKTFDELLDALRVLGHKVLLPSYGVDGMIAYLRYVPLDSDGFTAYIFESNDELVAGWHFAYTASEIARMQSYEMELQIRVRPDGGGLVLAISDVPAPGASDALPRNHTESLLALQLGREPETDRIEVHVRFAYSGNRVRLDTMPIVRAIRSVPGLDTSTLESRGLAIACLDHLRGDLVGEPLLRLRDTAGNVLTLDTISGIDTHAHPGQPEDVVQRAGSRIVGWRAGDFVELVFNLRSGAGAQHARLQQMSEQLTLALLEHFS